MDSIKAIIEITANSTPVKYEIDHHTNELVVDRFIATSMMYPCNYGFFPDTLGEDGDPLDVLVITPYPLYPCAAIQVRPVGVLLMKDESGSDAKVIAVPASKLTAEYDHVKDIEDISKQLLDRIRHFFESYKQLEKGKWVEMDRFADKAQAIHIIEKAKKDFHK